MPRLVDHEVRRKQITGAVRAVIARGGLEAATFQAVAAEAGISVRLVQYYFGNKRDLLIAAHRAVIDDAGARFMQRWAALGEHVTPREAIHAILIELLPLDAARRRDALVLGAFHATALTGAAISPGESLEAPRALVAVIADQLARARDTDPTASAVEPTLDAELILATMGGLAQGMLPGHYSEELAVQLTDRLLDRVFGTAGH